MSSNGSPTTGALGIAINIANDALAIVGPRAGVVVVRGVAAAGTVVGTVTTPIATELVWVVVVDVIGVVVADVVAVVVGVVSTGVAVVAVDVGVVGVDAEAATGAAHPAQSASDASSISLIPLTTPAWPTSFPARGTFRALPAIIAIGVAGGRPWCSQRRCCLDQFREGRIRRARRHQW